MSEIEELKERVRVLEQMFLTLASREYGEPFDMDVSDIPYFNTDRCQVNPDTKKWEVIK